MARPGVGTAAWEAAGGPPLSLPQRAALLGGMGLVLGAHAGGVIGGRLRRHPEVDLAAWAPPDTDAVRAAVRRLEASSSPEFVNHSYRSYYFSAAVADLAALPVDREALFVAVALHDVGLFTPPLPGERCFTVTGARVARQVAADAGWAGPRADRVAAAITANLNPTLPAGHFGLEAAVFRRGGLVDVLAQGWKLHPATLAWILERYPRTGFAAETQRVISAEVRRNPGCRFACYGPVFPLLVRASRFPGGR